MEYVEGGKDANGSTTRDWKETCQSIVGFSAVHRVLRHPDLRNFRSTGCVPLRYISYYHHRTHVSPTPHRMINNDIPNLPYVSASRSTTLSYLHIIQGSKRSRTSAAHLRTGNPPINISWYPHGTFVPASPSSSSSSPPPSAPSTPPPTSTSPPPKSTCGYHDILIGGFPVRRCAADVRERLDPWMMWR